MHEFAERLVSSENSEFILEKFVLHSFLEEQKFRLNKIIDFTDQNRNLCAVKKRSVQI